MHKKDLGHKKQKQMEEESQNEKEIKNPNKTKRKNNDLNKENNNRIHNALKKYDSENSFISNISQTSSQKYNTYKDNSETDEDTLSQDIPKYSILTL